MQNLVPRGLYAFRVDGLQVLLLELRGRRSGRPRCERLLRELCASWFHLQVYGRRVAKPQGVHAVKLVANATLGTLSRRDNSGFKHQRELPRNMRPDVARKPEAHERQTRNRAVRS